MRAARFRSRPQRWNQRRARAFGLGGGIMAPIERFFIATAVSGFMGLIASIVWLIIRAWAVTLRPVRRHPLATIETALSSAVQARCSRVLPAERAPFR